MARDLVIRIIGDSRQLERSLKKSERSVQSFSSTVTKKTRASMQSFAVGLPAAAGAGALLLGKQFVDAARNAEVILGQTSIAVQDAGLSWNIYGKQVQDASQRISKASAFDDEAVLQSFQVFVRGQKDVAQSLKLTELAADVARGRYIDLESATQIVNKAAMGQIGALRRAGIQIDKNATSAQALDALNRAYANSATTYANSAAGSADKLRVAWENLSEQAGGPLSEALAGVATQLTAIVELGQKAGGIKLPKVPVVGGGGTLGGLESKLGGLLMMPGAAPILITKGIIDKIRGGGGGEAAAPGVGGFGASIFKNVQDAFTGLKGIRPVVKKAAAEEAAMQREATARGVTRRNTWFDALISRQLDRVQDIPTLKGQIARLREIGALVQQRIAATKDITRRLNLEDTLADVRRQIRGDEAQIAADQKQRDADAKQRQQEQLQAARDRAISAAALTVQRAGLTKNLTDDLAALKRQVVVLKQQHAAATEVLAAQQAVNDKEAEIAQAQTDRMAKRVQAQLDAANLAVAKTGLTDTLKDDLARNQDLLKVMQKTHQDAIDIVNQQIRIKDLRKQIADQIAAGADATDKAADEAGRTVSSSRKLFKHLSATAFINRFGADLNRQQKRRLEIGLAMMGPGGTSPAGQSRAFTAGLTINGGVHMHGVQDVPGLENQLAKRAKARPHVRRGARG